MVVVLGTVHIAEGAIAHFLDELPAFQSRVAGQFSFAFALLGHYALEYGGIVVFLLLFSLVLSVSGYSGRMTGLGGDISVVSASSGGVGVLLVCSTLQRLMCLHVRVAHAILLVCLLCGAALIVVLEALLLSVYVGDMGGGLILG